MSAMDTGQNFTNRELIRHTTAPVDDANAEQINRKLLAAQNPIISDPSELLRQSLAHSEEYLVSVLGTKLLVTPHVMSPQYSYAPTFIIRHWDIVPGMNVLDVGTGSGVLAIFAAHQCGAAHVTALDINPHAIRCTQKNIERFNLQGTVVAQLSDAYSSFKDETKFDRILFNAPYWNQDADPANPLSYALYDKDYASTRRVLSGAHDYLAPHGKVLLGFASQDDVKLMERVIAESGFTVEEIKRETRGHERLLYYLVPR